MKQMDLDKLIAFTKSLEGQVITTTSQRREFTVRVRDSGFEYTPISSGILRKNPYKIIERVLNRFQELGSFQPSRYVDVTRNASYLMTILELYSKQH